MGRFYWVAKESTHVIVCIGESLFYSFSSVAARDGIYNSMTFSDRPKLLESYGFL